MKFAVKVTDDCKLKLKVFSINKCYTRINNKTEIYGKFKYLVEGIVNIIWAAAFSDQNQTAQTHTHKDSFNHA